MKGRGGGGERGGGKGEDGNLRLILVSTSVTHLHAMKLDLQLLLVGLQTAEARRHMYECCTDAEQYTAHAAELILCDAVQPVQWRSATSMPQYRECAVQTYVCKDRKEGAAGVSNQPS